MMAGALAAISDYEAVPRWKLYTKMVKQKDRRVPWLLKDTMEPTHQFLMLSTINYYLV